MPRSCCEETAQCFCFDIRCAFPCNDKVPCACGAYGLICAYDWIVNVGCCRTLGTIDPKYGPQNKPVRAAVRQVPQQVHMHQQQPQQVVYVQQPQQVVYVQQPQPVMIVQQPQVMYAQPQTVVYAQQQPTYR